MWSYASKIENKVDGGIDWNEIFRVSELEQEYNYLNNQIQVGPLRPRISERLINGL